MSTPLTRSALPGANSVRAHWPLRAVLAALEVLIGVGGLYGGAAMLRNPQTPMGVTTGLLTGGPFHTFTGPGVLLLALLGITPLLLAVALLARVRGAVALSAAFGTGTMAWIVVQWLLLSDHLWLQPAVFCTGLLITAVALLALRRGAR